MTIDETTAAKEIKRLASLNTWRHLESAGRAELARTLAAACATPYQAHRVLDRWLEENTQLPAPADLRRVASETPIHPPVPAKDCPICHGNGRESFWALFTRIRDGNTVVRKTLCEKIEVYGDKNLWLTRLPDVAKHVENKTNPDQFVRMLCGYCSCETGRRLKDLQTATT